MRAVHLRDQAYFRSSCLRLTTLDFLGRNASRVKDSPILTPCIVVRM